MLTFNMLKSELRLSETDARSILEIEKKSIDAIDKMYEMSHVLKGHYGSLSLGDEELDFVLCGSLNRITISHYKGTFSINAPNTIITTYSYELIRKEIDSYDLHSDKFQGNFVSNVNVTIDLVKKELLLRFNETVINDLGFSIWEYVRSVYRN